MKTFGDRLRLDAALAELVRQNGSGVFAEPSHVRSLLAAQYGVDAARFQGDIDALSLVLTLGRTATSPTEAAARAVAESGLAEQDALWAIDAVRRASTRPGAAVPAPIDVPSPPAGPVAVSHPADSPDVAAPPATHGSTAGAAPGGTSEPTRTGKAPWLRLALAAVSLVAILLGVLLALQYSEVSDRDAQLNAAREELATVAAERDALSTDLGAAESERDSLRRTITATNKELTDAEAELEATSEQLDAMSETVRLEVDEVGPSEELFTGSLDWSGCAGFEDDVEACESVFDVEVRFADYGDRLVANLGEFGSYELLSVDGVTYVGNAQAPFSGVICGDVESIGSWVISMVPSQLSVRADGSEVVAYAFGIRVEVPEQNDCVAASYILAGTISA